MMWTTIPSSNSRPELPQTFKSTALAAAVARREQARNALMADSTDAASLATADAGVCSPLSPPASRSAGQSAGKTGLRGGLNLCRSRKQRTSLLCSNAELSCPSPPFSPRTGPVARSSPTSE
ncbi:hypothetical protein HPB50_018831 [Hyalomma asiaticum]|uniref:Uncharacterized protein n=1 Tax=Hyalomma asiaticum TaxID=266040 RepID=A0ACB7S297_HYAAI|nr:hypothetical protein HPB50_018831 [Hyalomma asiaticum]